MHAEPSVSGSQRRLQRLDQPAALRGVQPQAVLDHGERARVLTVDARVAELREFEPQGRGRHARGDRHRKAHQQQRLVEAGERVGQCRGDALRVVALHRLSALPAVQSRGAREQQLQVIVDLAHGPDGRARRAHGIELIDRDGRRNMFDPVDLRLVHAIEELARVRGEGLDVAPLALRVQRVEHQRGLAGPGYAGDDDQLAQRQVEVEIA
jgi:hypothetical protein